MTTSRYAASAARCTPRRAASDRLAWRVELAHWLRLAGDPVDPAELAGSTHPYALSARGDWRGAADGWAAAGYPYEAAAALTGSDDDEVVLSGLAGLDALGGVRLADRVREDLRRRGVVRVPRGPIPATRDNVAGLTPRQLDVLTLLAEGLPNAAIAERLVLSVRTVDHHVAALMAKLGAVSRHEGGGSGGLAGNAESAGGGLGATRPVADSAWRGGSAAPALAWSAPGARRGAARRPAGSSARCPPGRTAPGRRPSATHR